MRCVSTRCWSLCNVRTWYALRVRVILCRLCIFCRLVHPCLLFFHSRQTSKNSMARLVALSAVVGVFSFEICSRSSSVQLPEDMIGSCRMTRTTMAKNLSQSQLKSATDCFIWTPGGCLENEWEILWFYCSPRFGVSSAGWVLFTISQSTLVAELFVFSQIYYYKINKLIISFLLLLSTRSKHSL